MNRLNLDKAFVEKVKNLVKSGLVEIYVNPVTSDSDVIERVSVFTSPGHSYWPRTASERDEIERITCGQLADSFFKTLGRPITIYDCGFRPVSDLYAFYVQSDGADEGTKSIQYRLPKSPDVTITIQGTCRNDSLQIFRKEFGDMIASFELR